MKVIVTCGPSHEPIDRVRRITNFSTGELGVLLTEALAGVPVLCFKGAAATWRDPRGDAEMVSFGTNDDLLAKLRTAAASEKVAVVLHAAALADYRVSSVEAGGQSLPRDGKIRSDAEFLTLRLTPAPKILRVLRSLFPAAWIAGWKYELEGGKEEALARGRAQISSNSTNACMVNGPAYGAGFGWLDQERLVGHYADKPALCRALVEEVRRRLQPA